MMIGQRELRDSLQKLIDAQILPRTILFEGPWGCGKHTLVYELAQHLDLPYKDITHNLNLETLESIQLAPLPCVYIIDASRISIKEQNTILKFLEEPLKTSYICVLCESKHRLLNTVLNRCYVRSFAGYTLDELSEFWGDSELRNHPVSQYANTPGRIIQMRDTDSLSCWEMANKILLKTKVASYANVLTIPSKFYYKEPLEGKLDFNLFSYFFNFAAMENYKIGEISFQQLESVRSFCNDLWIANINKANLFEHFLIAYKREFGGDVN